jgi:hypothetical protein
MVCFRNVLGNFVFESAADKNIKVRTGQGTYTSATKDVYVGEFKEGKEDGQGTQTWANGNQYVDPLEAMNVPLPVIFPSLNSPTYWFPFAQVCVP